MWTHRWLSRAELKTNSVRQRLHRLHPFPNIISGWKRTLKVEQPFASLSSESAGCWLSLEYRTRSVDCSVLFRSNSKVGVWHIYGYQQVSRFLVVWFVFFLTVTIRGGLLMFKKADLFLLLGVLISFFVSGYLWFNGQRIEGIFTAIWVPAILGFGIYFKLMLIRGRMHDWSSIILEWRRCLFVDGCRCRINWNRVSTTCQNWRTERCQTIWIGYTRIELLPMDTTSVWISASYE